jgi:hypothetical protein
MKFVQERLGEVAPCGTVWLCNIACQLKLFALLDALL